MTKPKQSVDARANAKALKDLEKIRMKLSTLSMDLVTVMHELSIAARARETTDG